MAFPPNRAASNWQPIAEAPGHLPRNRGLQPAASADCGQPQRQASTSANKQKPPTELRERPGATAGEQTSFRRNRRRAHHAPREALLRAGDGGRLAVAGARQHRAGIGTRSRSVSGFFSPPHYPTRGSGGSYTGVAETVSAFKQPRISAVVGRFDRPQRTEHRIPPGKAATMTVPPMARRTATNGCANKCLARSNKSRRGAEATKKWNRQ